MQKKLLELMWTLPEMGGKSVGKNGEFTGEIFKKNGGKQSDCDRNLLSLEIPFQAWPTQPPPIPSPFLTGGI